MKSLCEPWREWEVLAARLSAPLPAWPGLADAPHPGLWLVSPSHSGLWLADTLAPPARALVLAPSFSNPQTSLEWPSVWRSVTHWERDTSVTAGPELVTELVTVNDFPNTGISERAAQWGEVILLVPYFKYFILTNTRNKQSFQITRRWGKLTSWCQRRWARKDCKNPLSSELCTRCLNLFTTLKWKLVKA